MTESTSYILAISLVFWLVMAAVWGYFSHGIFSENKRIKEEIPTLPTLHYLLTRLAALQKRNLQLWCAVSLLFLLCAIGNIASIIHSVAPTPAPVIEPAPPGNSQKTDKPIKTAPGELVKTAPNATSANPVPASNPLPYSDITEFNEKDSKEQAMIDWLKQRYENTFITYYYLQKCGLADKNDFDVIRSSLHKELADLHTETNTAEDNILMAANGSYNELYAQASCADDRTKATKTSYDAFMQQMRQPKPSAISVAPAGNPVPKSH
jgi:hypothetical protein